MKKQKVILINSLRIKKNASNFQRQKDNEKYEEKYGKKAEQVFYASVNKGTITDVHK